MSNFPLISASEDVGVGRMSVFLGRSNALYTIILAAADALLVVILSAILCVSVLSLFNYVVDVLLSILWMPKYFNVRAS